MELLRISTRRKLCGDEDEFPFFLIPNLRNQKRKEEKRGIDRTCLVTSPWLHVVPTVADSAAASARREEVFRTDPEHKHPVNRNDWVLFIIEESRGPALPDWSDTA
jgi:hypothetical protein